MEKTENTAVEFGVKIADLAFDSGADFTTIFNGLAFAASVFLLDYTSVNGKVNEQFYASSTEQFINAVKAATEYGLAMAKESSQQ